MSIPLVSVAMPVFNAEKYIKQAIDSILNQTYVNFELIIVNDGSTDKSKEIILTYADKRILYIENETNIGIAKTRNKCIQCASGKYIAVLDNDDIALPCRLEKQVEFLEADSSYGLCGSFYEIIDGKGHLISKMKLPVTDHQVKTYLLFDNCFCNSSVMVHSYLLKERFYSEGYDMIEDYHFLYSVSEFKKLFIIPLYITQYRKHGKNTSIEKLDGMRNIRKKMDRAILTGIGIPYSEEEFAIHTNFFTDNLDFFNNDSVISRLESWLMKLYQFLKLSQRYDMTLIEKIFTRRWISIFKRTRSKSFRIVFNKLSIRFKVRYLKYFLELLTEKYSKQRSAA